VGQPDIPPKMPRPSWSNYKESRRIPDYLSTGIFDSRLLSDLQSRIPGVLVYFWDMTKVPDGQVDKILSDKIISYNSNE
jgi:hypothetical protein